MKHYITALVLAGGLAATQVHAACNYPVAPGKFPDGNQATQGRDDGREEVGCEIQRRHGIYLTCIKSEYDAKVAAEANATAEQKAEMARVQDQKHNAAVEEVQAVADRFNEQLRAWKAKTAAEKKEALLTATPRAAGRLTR